MHYLVIGINFQIHSANLTSLVLIHLLIHLSTHRCHHLRSHHPSLFHSFTPGPQAQNLPFQQILLTHTGLPRDNGTGPDRTYHVHQFIFSFSF